MIIQAFFTDANIPKTGLTPTIDIWTKDGTQVINGSNMTEIDGGFYYYDFTTYDFTESYSFRADGGVSLTNAERYVFGSNDASDVETIVDAVWDEPLLSHQIANSMGYKMNHISSAFTRNITKGSQWRRDEKIKFKEVKDSFRAYSSVGRASGS